MSMDSPLIRRHTRSRERDTKAKDMFPPSKVSKVLPLNNEKKALCKPTGNVDKGNNATFGNAKNVRKVH